MGRDLTWIVWAGVATLANRVLMVWVYNRAQRSVFTSVLYHTMINVTYSMFPVEGSHYDPLVTGGLLAGLAGLVFTLHSSRKTPTLKR